MQSPAVLEPVYCVVSSLDGQEIKLRGIAVENTRHGAVVVGVNALCVPEQAENSVEVDGQHIVFTSVGKREVSVGKPAGWTKVYGLDPWPSNSAMMQAYNLFEGEVSAQSGTGALTEPDGDAPGGGPYENRRLFTSHAGTRTKAERSASSSANPMPSHLRKLLSGGGPLVKPPITDEFGMDSEDSFGEGVLPPLRPPKRPQGRAASPPEPLLGHGVDIRALAQEGNLSAKDLVFLSIAEKLLQQPP